MKTSRRGFISGLVSFVAAPAIVRAGSLMPVKAIPDDLWLEVAERIVNPPLYGISPCMQALEYLKEYDRIVARIIRPEEYLL